MEQNHADSDRPKPHFVPRLLPLRDISGLGQTLLRGVVLRVVGEAEKLARHAAEGDRATAFANLILSNMLVDPVRNPEEIDSLPPEAIAALVEVAATSIGSRPEFDALSSDLPPRERLYQSYLEAERTYFEKQNREIEALRKSIDASMEPIRGAAQTLLDASAITALQREHIDEFLGRTAAIGAKLMADDAAALGAALDKSLLTTLDDSYRLALDSVMRASLSELVEEATQLTPPEPFLSDALIASGINTPLLHSPTYTLPSVEAIESPEEVEPRAKEKERQRLSDAYDTLCHLEMTLRAFIEGQLRQLHGHKWWKAGVPPQIREDCEKRKRERESTKSASHPAITYAYVDDYRAIIQKGDNWRELFQSVFANPSELETCFLWVGRVRNDIAHFRPIPDDKYTRFTVGAHWIQAAMAQAMDATVEEN